MTVMEYILLTMLATYVLITILLIIKHMIKKRNKAKAALRIIK